MNCLSKLRQAGTILARSFDMKAVTSHSRNVASTNDGNNEYIEKSARFVPPKMLKPSPGDLIEIKYNAMDIKWVICSKNPEFVVPLQCDQGKETIEFKELIQIADGGKVRVHNLNAGNNSSCNKTSLIPSKATDSDDAMIAFLGTLGKLQTKDIFLGFGKLCIYFYLFFLIFLSTLTILFESVGLVDNKVRKVVSYLK